MPLSWKSASGSGWRRCRNFSSSNPAACSTPSPPATPGRNFVVLYSSFVEALGPSSPMIKFLMGHEIGHLRRKHPVEKGLPDARNDPAADRRGVSSRVRGRPATATGAYAANDLNASMLALTVLASGREASNVNTTYFADQYFATRGFFVSWHELIVNYPTLSQRVAQILGFADAKYASRPGRHPLAYPFALLFSTKNILFLYLAVVVAISVPHCDRRRGEAQAGAGRRTGASSDWRRRTRRPTANRPQPDVQPAPAPSPEQPAAPSSAPHHPDG